MRDFVSNLLSNNVVEARNIIEERIKNLIEEKLIQVKMRITADLYEDVGVDVDFIDGDELDESSSMLSTPYGQNRYKGSGSKATVRRSTTIKMGREKKIRVRIRRGKIQRNRLFSAIKGFTVRGGKLTRMSSTERMHRKISSRRSRFKRRAKLQVTLRKRRMSLRRRRAMGI